MKKKLIAACVFLALGLPAFAADQTVTVTATPVLDSDNQFYSVTTPGDGVLSGGEDILSFVGLAPGKYDFSIAISGQNVTFDPTKTTLNGATGIVVGTSKFSFLGIETVGNAPFQLHLFGAAAAGGLYSGNVTVTAVPEPETYALLLAGMALLGTVAKRRNSKNNG